MFTINERKRFEIKVVDILPRPDNRICYVFSDSENNILLFETKKSYQLEYDDKFSRYNKISALIEFINGFNGKVVISNLRFVK